MTTVIHETVHFSGHVQGVGFRYTARQVAKEFEVTGFVQNLTDGRVRAEIEGRASEIDAYVAAVQERMDGYVRQIERSRAPRAPQFADFEIR